MRMTVVGSGDAFGWGGRFQICIALAPHDASSPTVLLDCGATSLTALRQQEIDTNAIDTVIVSHLHGDHFGGLPFLVLDGQFRRRTQDLTVIGPPGTQDRLEQTMEVLYPGSSTVQRRFDVRVVEHVDRHALELGPLRVTPFEVRHASGAPAYALRVDGSDGSVAYSGGHRVDRRAARCRGRRTGVPLRGLQPRPGPLAPRPRHPRQSPRQADLPTTCAHAPVHQCPGQRPGRLERRPRRPAPRPP